MTINQEIDDLENRLIILHNERSFDRVTTAIYKLSLVLF
jgi:hypothetical protein